MGMLICNFKKFVSSRESPSFFFLDILITPVNIFWFLFSIPGVLLHHTSHISAQGTTSQPPQNLAYFDGTAQATVNTVLNLQTGIVFSFRTCNGGELLSQTGANGDSINFQVESSTGAFRVQWTVGGVSDTLALGSNFNGNLWKPVEVESVLGQLMLTVGDNSTILSNTLNTIDLSGGDLVIGNTYDGCLEETRGLNLASASDHTNVRWGDCPLDLQNGCGKLVVNRDLLIGYQFNLMGSSYLCSIAWSHWGILIDLETKNCLSLGVLISWWKFILYTIYVIQSPS